MRSQRVLAASAARRSALALWCLAAPAAPTVAQPCPVEGTGFTEQEVVNELAWLDAGDGARMYAGLSSPTAAVRVRDGDSWSAVGERSQTVRALAVFDAGNGPALYAGGSSTTSVGKVARFDGADWQELDAGGSGSVHDLIVFDDGSGPALYAAGSFETIGGVTASGIARWNGTAWSPLGTGLAHADGPAGYALEVFDNGAGPALYVAGRFTSAGGVPTSRIARWDGSAWSALGDGLAADTRTLVVFDDGSGPALYTAPDSSDGLRRWDGTGWGAVGAGVILFNVSDLAVHDDGRGPAIFTAGDHWHQAEPPAGLTVHGPFRWDGAAWEFWNTFGPGHDYRSRAIASDGQGLLYASAKNISSSRCNIPETLYAAVRYACSADVCAADLNCDGVLDGADIAAFAGRLQLFQEPSADFNADGLINFFDVSAYLRAFTAGCP